MIERPDPGRDFGVSTLIDRKEVFLSGRSTERRRELRRLRKRREEAIKARNRERRKAAQKSAAAKTGR